MTLSSSDWFGALDATWPAQEMIAQDGWVFRVGAGGGKRVSATTGLGDIALAERVARDHDQTALFMIRDGLDDQALDHALAARGYEIIDPVILMAREVAGGAPLPEFEISDRAREIWAKGGIGPPRLAVMERTKGPKAVLEEDGGVAFFAQSSDVAMIHALEVHPDMRRRGVGRCLVTRAIEIAPQGWLAAAVVDRNHASLKLFESLGFQPVARYHYRIKVENL